MAERYAHLATPALVRTTPILLANTVFFSGTVPKEQVLEAAAPFFNIDLAQCPHLAIKLFDLENSRFARVCLHFAYK
jgi:hypothetical protein